MPESGANEHEHFIKQRRNLILISLVLIFYKAGELQFNTINFLGNQTDIGNPEVVPVALGAFFLYFLWRYYTACRGVSGVKEFWKSCSRWFEQRCGNQIIAVLKKCNVNYTQSPKIKKSYVTKVLISFSPYTGYKNEVHGKEIAAEFVRVEKTGEKIYSFGIQYWPWRIFSTFHSIVNLDYFSNAIVPYIIALFAISELLGVEITQYLIALL